MQFKSHFRHSQRDNAREKRVAAIPETVEKLVAGRATVLVEKGAGEGAYFMDDDYRKAGARIVEDVAVIYAESDVVLKAKEPLFNSEKNKHEVEMMPRGQVLVTFLHPAAPDNHEMVRKLAEQGVTSLTLDGIPRISRAQAMDALTSMSTVAGYKSVLMAANRIAKFLPMIGSAVGMIQPANVLVLGTGVAGLQAVATAKGWAPLSPPLISAPTRRSTPRAWARRLSTPGFPQRWPSVKAATRGTCPRNGCSKRGKPSLKPWPGLISSLLRPWFPEGRLLYCSPKRWSNR